MDIDDDPIVLSHPAPETQRFIEREYEAGGGAGYVDRCHAVLPCFMCAHPVQRLPHNHATWRKPHDTPDCRGRTTPTSPSLS